LQSRDGAEEIPFLNQAVVRGEKKFIFIAAAVNAGVLIRKLGKTATRCWRARGDATNLLGAW
jgi:hypothetical protein